MAPALSVPSTVVAHLLGLAFLLLECRESFDFICLLKYVSFSSSSPSGEEVT